MDRYKLTGDKNEIVVEDKTIKSYGDNYIPARVKNRINLGFLLKLVIGFFVFVALILAILVLCGI